MCGVIAIAGGSWNNTNGVQGTLPCDPSAWCKVQQGWVNVLVVSSPEQALQIMDVKKGNRNVFRVDIKGDGTGTGKQEEGGGRG